MSDLLATGVQLPNLEEGQGRVPDRDGFIRVYARQDKLYGLKPDNTEVLLSGGGGGEVTVLKISGGNSSTTFQDYKLRFDFGSVGGSSINPSGTP